MPAVYIDDSFRFNWDIWKNTLAAFTIILARPMATFSIIPFLNTTSIPGIAQTAMTINLMIFMCPLLMPELMAVSYEQIGLLSLLIILLKEGMLGLFIGFLMALPVWVAQNVGFFIDNQRGTTMASVFNPLSGDTTSPLGIFYNVTVTALFMNCGGLLVFIGILYGSYLWWPILHLVPISNPQLPLFFLDAADHMLRSSVLFASPMVMAMFLTDFSLGLMNRFAPQLNVFFVSMPIKSAISLFLMVLFMSAFFKFMQEEFYDSFRMLDILHYLIPPSHNPISPI